MPVPYMKNATLIVAFSMWRHQGISRNNDNETLTPPSAAYKQWVSIGSDSGLSPIRRQANI